MKTNLNSSVFIHDIIMGILFLSVVGTNVAWYSYAQNQNKIAAEAWLMNRKDIGKLQDCYEQNAKPCHMDVEINK